ncbi:hypothetical protein ACTFIV_001666 [Dictyostelium citrinum]
MYKDKYSKTRKIINQDEKENKRIKKENNEISIDSLIIDSPVGPLIIKADDKSLCSVLPLVNPTKEQKELIIRNENNASNIFNNEILKQFNTEVEQYFKGSLKEFKTPYKKDLGTEFQKKVWNQIKTIPYGTTLSYSDIAAKLGLSKLHSRAIGSCCRKHLLFYLIIPVHRVVSKSGKPSLSCTINNSISGCNKQLILQNIEKNNI